MSIAIATGLIVVCYLAGAIPFGLLVVKAFKGIDIRTVGSGNIGATNVARAAGRKVAVLVFLLDFAKGYLPVLGVLLLSKRYEPSQLLPVLAGLATVVGHMFPVYLKFRGGKGVATGAGMLAALVPLPLGIAFIVWVLVVGASRYISLASICAVVALPVSFIVLNGGNALDGKLTYTVFCVVIAALVIVRHRSNIKRLLSGTENRVGGKKKVSESPGSES